MIILLNQSYLFYTYVSCVAEIAHVLASYILFLYSHSKY